MCLCSRRNFLALSGCAASQLFVPMVHAQAAPHAPFIIEAIRMRSEAVARGDQAYGAVVVRGGTVIGNGPSRVVTDRNPDAHAERVALWDAQRRIGAKNLRGAVIYSTSRPCSACENELAAANIERMYYGPEATDGGKPHRH